MATLSSAVSNGHFLTILNVHTAVKTFYILYLVLILVLVCNRQNFSSYWESALSPFMTDQTPIFEFGKNLKEKNPTEFNPQKQQWRKWATRLLQTQIISLRRRDVIAITVNFLRFLGAGVGSIT